MLVYYTWRSSLLALAISHWMNVKKAKKKKAEEFFLIAAHKNCDFFHSNAWRDRWWHDKELKNHLTQAALNDILLRPLLGWFSPLVHDSAMMATALAFCLFLTLLAPCVYFSLTYPSKQKIKPTTTVTGKEPKKIQFIHFTTHIEQLKIYIKRCQSHFSCRFATGDGDFVSICPIAAYDVNCKLKIKVKRERLVIIVEFLANEKNAMRTWNVVR